MYSHKIAGLFPIKIITLITISRLFTPLDGSNARFLVEMLGNLSSEEVALELSLPNRAGILTPADGLDEGEEVTMLVMPVMLNN